MTGNMEYEIGSHEPLQGRKQASLWRYGRKYEEFL